MIYQITEPRTGFRMALPWRGDLVKKGFEEYITNIPSSLGVDAYSINGFDWEFGDSDGVEIDYTCQTCGNPETDADRWAAEHGDCSDGHSVILYPVMLKALERDMLYSN